MSKTSVVCCPVCYAEYSLETLFEDASTRQAFARLVTLSLPLGTKLLAYVGLFAPARNRMSISRKVKLLEEVLTCVERGEIERKGRWWAADRDAWATAIDQMLDLRAAGKLTLPLTSHGYLFEILASQADKREAQAERQHEQTRRDRRETASAAGAGTAIGEVLGALQANAPVSSATPGTSPLVRRMQAAMAERAKSTGTEEEKP